MKTKIKFKKLLTASLLLMAGLVSGCVKDDFPEIIGVCPAVESTNPVDKSMGVPLSKIITVTFNEEINPATLTDRSFTIQGLSPVTGSITYSGKTATFKPANPLMANVTYTGKITTAVKDMMGNAIQEDYIWTFSTDETPVVTLTSPYINEGGVLLNKKITAQFNMAMTPSTLNGTTFTIKRGEIAVLGSVSYDGTTLMFTPASDLMPDIQYTARITIGAKSLAGMPLTADYVWTFSTGQVPAVLSTDPVSNAASVNQDKIISARFNMPMDPISLMGATFSIKQGLIPVMGTVTYNGTDLFFIPSGNLIPGVEYTATISTGAKSLTGIPMAANYVWKFTTSNSIGPKVISTNPVNQESDVNVKKIITAKFSMLMDPLSLNGSSFTLFRGAVKVDGTVTYNGDDVSFLPLAELLPGTEYIATITTGAKNSQGVALASDYVWEFTTLVRTVPTVTSTSPENLETNVTVKKIITAEFSMLMDPLTLNGSTFTIFRGSTQVPGTITYNGNNVSFIPLSDLMPGEEYTATITTGAKNLAGKELAANYVWKFSTLSLVAPTVISTNPVNLSTDVVLNKVVSATFSVPMDPQTITGTNFTLYRGTTPVAGSVTYANSVAFFTPSSALLPDTEYTATIKTGVSNILGTSLTNNYVWKFTTLSLVVPTVISTNPVNLSTNVALNKVVSATFSVPMDPSTINGTNFTLFRGTTPVTGAVSYSNSVAFFTPSSDLLPDTEYTATVKNGVKNTLGTFMVNNYIWKFTTTSPIVIAPLFSSAFGSFGGNAGVTNQGIYTVINNGSIGTTAASTLVTGFHDSTGDIYSETPLNIGDVKGRIYTAPPAPVVFEAGGPYGGNATTMALAQEALLAARNFYNSISPASKPGGITLDNDELGGRTLAPGIYKSGSSYKISTVDLVLDAQGDANAVWIFQMPTSLTVGIPSGARSVILINGAQPKNIYWYVGTSAVINYAGGGVMAGTIIADSGVTLSSPGNSTNTTVRTVLNGRAISLVSSVTMVNTVINVPQ